MKVTATRSDAYDLFHQGTLALAQAEANGIRIDTKYLRRTIDETGDRITSLDKQLQEDKVWKVWKRRFGSRANINSRPQLGVVLFEELGIEGGVYTEKTKDKKNKKERRWKVDEEVLEKIHLEFVQNLVKVGKLKKLESTYLRGVLREVSSDGLLHPSFNLNTVITYRSCVAKGTLIEIVRDVAKNPNGIPIEDVRTGDFAYCYDENRNLTIRRVRWAGRTGHKRVLRLHWSARGKKGHLDVTPEHRIRMASGEYIKASDLAGGDFRKDGESHHAPRIHVLAMGRCGDRLFQTNRHRDILDHRLVYETLKKPIQPGMVIHHKNENHLDNRPKNLQQVSPSFHAQMHEHFTNDDRRKGMQVRRERHHNGTPRWPSGKESANYLDISRNGFLVMLARAGGRLTKVPHDFNTLKKKADEFGIDLQKVKDRYDNRGRYISRGRLIRLHKLGRTVMMQTLGINFYKVKRLLEDRGLSTSRKWGNQFGEFIPHNHRITRVEWINRTIDVYDLEIEDCHNFIANEICVHNSGSDPNFQNIPIRDPEIAELIRRAFIPRRGRYLVEIDFKGAEVCVSACYNHDPKLIEYVSDPTTDMHRDVAAQIFKLKTKQIQKPVRQTTKTNFVFAQFYGAWYKTCAEKIWYEIEKYKLTTDAGVSLYEHLADQGITERGACDPSEDAEPGTFERRIQDVEKNFWGKRFSVYAQWKKDWYQEYQSRGYFDMLTGFRCSGVMGKKEVCNYPVQGASFHCLLWSLIQLQNWLNRHDMKSLIIGQIHDSILLDVSEDELEDVTRYAVKVITKKLPQHYDWICVPITAEIEASNENWFKKKPLHQAV